MATEPRRSTVQDLRTLKQLETTWRSGYQGKLLLKEEPKYQALTILDPHPGDETPMLQACAKGDLERVKSILEATKNASLEEKDEHGLTPLFMAMCFGHAVLADFLLDLGASITHHDTLGNAALHHAVALGSVYFVNRLIEMGAQVAEDVQDTTLDAKARTAKRNRAISCAMMTGHIEITQILLQHGATLHDEVLTGPSPIWSAVAMDQVELVAWIVKQRPDVLQERSDDPDSLVDMALNWGSCKTTKWLVENGHLTWKYRNKYDQNILIIAASRGCYELLELALQTPELGVAALEDTAEKSGDCTALDAAATDNRPECLKLLIAMGADIHGPRDEGMLTPVIRAAHSGALEALEILLEAGASLEPDLAVKSSPLHKAATHNHLRVVEYLVEKKHVDIHVLDESLRPALHVACQMGHLEIAKYLVSHGANPSLVVDLGANYLPTTLLLAVYSKSKEMVEWLFALAPELAHVKCSNGDSLMQLAFQYGSPEIVEWLIAQDLWKTVEEEDRTKIGNLIYTFAENGQVRKLELLYGLGGYDMRKPDSSGKPAIMYAAEKNHVACVEYLLPSFPVLHIFDKWGTLLHAAVEARANDVVELVVNHLVKQQMTVDARDNVGWTPAAVAIMIGAMPLVQLLARHGAVLTECALAPYSTMGLAAMSGNVELMKWLLAQGVPPPRAPRAKKSENLDIDDVDAGTSPHAFLLAVRSNRLEMCQYLVAEHGFNLHEIDNDGFSMLYEAVRGDGSVPLMEWLFESGVSIHAPASNGTTPFHKACADGLLPVAKWLHKHGVSVLTQSARGTSALFFASAYGHLPLVKWLIAHGANPFDRNGRLALPAASDNNQTAVCNFLRSIRQEDNLTS